MSKDEEFLKAVQEGIVGAQMYAMPAFYVLRELIADVAKLHPKPDAYVSDLYDRVARRLDPRPDLPEAETVAQSRDMLGALFRDALSATKRG